MRTIRPYPEAITGTGFRHKPSPGYSGYVDLINRVIGTPTLDDPFADAVRLHELFHTRISIPDMANDPRVADLITHPDFNPATIQVTEDIRVNTAMRQIRPEGMPHHEAATSALQSHIDAAVAGLAPFGTVARMLIAAIGTGIFGNSCKTVSHAITRTKKAGDVHAAAKLRGARKLARAIAADLDLATYGNRRGMYTDPDGQRDAFILAIRIEPMIRVLDDAAPAPEDEDQDEPSTREKTETPSTGAYWGSVEVRDLPRPLSTHSKTLRIIAEDRGSLPRRMNRYATDGRIFQRRIRVRGGEDLAILIDVSGSMGAPPNWEILSRFPAATILAYGGQTRRRPYSGAIVRIAERGRVAEIDRIDEAIKDLGDNLIDGPALEYMGKLPGIKRRVWVSDGQATMINLAGDDIFCTRATMDAAAKIAARYGVKRYLNVREALHALTGKDPGEMPRKRRKRIR